MRVCIYIYTWICTYIHIYTYIHECIERERERARKRESEKERERDEETGRALFCGDSGFFCELYIYIISKKSPRKRESETKKHVGNR